MSDSIFVIHFLGEKPVVGSVLPVDGNAAHITFLAHLQVDNDDNVMRFVESVNEIAKATKPFNLTAGSKAMFGAKKDTPVVQVVDTSHGHAKALHFNLLFAAMKLGLRSAQPEFTANNFVPHVTIVDGEAPLVKGVNVTVDDVTVVRHIGGYGKGNVEVLANSRLEV